MADDLRHEAMRMVVLGPEKSITPRVQMALIDHRFGSLCGVVVFLSTAEGERKGFLRAKGLLTH